MKTFNNQYQWKEIGLASLFSLVLYPLAYLFVNQWFLAAVLCSIGSAGLMQIRKKYISNLKKRIEQNTGPDWDVVMNGVKASTISDADYALIRLQVFQDPRTYIAQVVNLFGVAYRVLNAFVWVLPLIVFWAILLGCYFFPNTMHSILAEIQNLGFMVALTRLVDSVAPAIGTTVAVVAVFLITFGSTTFGFVNRFSFGSGNAVRKHCGIAAEGNLTLVRWTDGCPHFNDEMEFVRRHRDRT
ncbi:hypothetical protein [Aquitalea palustris]|uniref:hypothetical protein n=1 Tax=Aquitalea palustris TaxID=2480983 RepID=UPI001CF077BD|nr:hypothetical protein [Aquitalea palustris]